MVGRGGGGCGVVLRNAFRIIQNQATLDVQGQNTVHLITSNISLLSWCNLLTYICCHLDNCRISLMSLMWKKDFK